MRKCAANALGRAGLRPKVQGQASGNPGAHGQQRPKGLEGPKTARRQPVRPHVQRLHGEHILALVQLGPHVELAERKPLAGAVATTGPRVDPDHAGARGQVHEGTLPVRRVLETRDGLGQKDEQGIRAHMGLDQGLGVTAVRALVTGRGHERRGTVVDLNVQLDLVALNQSAAEARGLEPRTRTRWLRAHDAHGRAVLHLGGDGLAVDQAYANPAKSPRNPIR